MPASKLETWSDWDLDEDENHNLIRMVIMDMVLMSMIVLFSHLFCNANVENEKANLTKKLGKAAEENNDD